MWFWESLYTRTTITVNIWQQSPSLYIELSFISYVIKFSSPKLTIVAGFLFDIDTEIFRIYYTLQGTRTRIAKQIITELKSGIGLSECEAWVLHTSRLTKRWRKVIIIINNSKSYTLDRFSFYFIVFFWSRDCVLMKVAKWVHLLHTTSKIISLFLYDSSTLEFYFTWRWRPKQCVQ